MSKIHVLSEAVANKIAAGEVVERPASIVKELVENSLDAGATQIEVEINNGGKSYIRVSDNGSGMSAEDVELSFKRHATSKIETDHDLNHILSFGFRGEALPSIAAVSKVTLQTRLAQEEAGTELVIEGGKTVHVKPCAAAKGTTVEIRDLFFNTPARRKFFRQDTTEMGHVVEVVSSIALSHPQVSFSLKSMKKNVFNLSGTKDLSKRVADIFGEEWKEEALLVSGESEGIRLRGVVGKPALAKRNRTGQYFFINKRWVKSLPLSYALQSGYHGFLMHDQHAAGVVFLEMDPEQVDVNVHPTKQQVKISAERNVKSLIKASVAEALEAAERMTPRLTEPMKEDPIERIKRHQGTFGMPPERPQVKRDLEATEKLFEPLSISEPVSSYQQREEYAETSQEIQKEEPISIQDSLRVTKIMGQVHGTFILVETEDGYAVIDQHAAHEKIQYESLIRNLESGNPVSQKLLMEEMFEIHPKQVEIFKSTEEFLSKLGFEVELFGETTIVVRGIPSIFKDEPGEKIIRTYLEEREDGKVSTRLESQRDEVAAILACKTHSIMAHHKLSFEEMKSLLESLSRLENPHCCPHGRPAILKYTFAELEKQFRRVH